MFYGIPKRKPGKPRNDGAGTFFGDLKAAMKKTDSAGAFAACGHDSGLPAPRLRVDGLDAPLAMPVPAEQAAALVSIAERAAFGRGEATIVDANRCVLYCWYDNEFGYSCQVVRIVQKLADISYPLIPAEVADIGFG